jgi:hypothetical protein
MAHNAILRVFKIYLKSIEERIPSFAELLVAKYPHLPVPTGNYDYNVHFTALFNEFISLIDNTFHTHARLKKAIGIESPMVGGAPNRTISHASQMKQISGRIKGGRFGQKRSLGDLNAPGAAHATIDSNKVVLDEFYFLIHTPIDSNKGILLIQNYTDDSINDIFIKFVRDLLTGIGFNKPTIDPFTPKHIRKAFTENSVIQEFRYTDDIFVTDVDTKNPVDGRQLRIQIKISVPQGEKPKNIPILRKLVGNLKLGINSKDSLSLDQFRSKMGTLKSGTKISSFDLEGSTDIQPVIDLNDKIEFQKDGSPDWGSLSSYCEELLEEILPEVYPENEES